MQQINRIMPLHPVTAYKTYAISFPKQTHTRPATCEEVGCEQWQYGWRTRLPLDSDLAVYLAAGTHGRRFQEIPTGTAEREFIFPPGQKCFRSTQHRIKLDRPGIYIVRGGDWRGATTEPRRHTRPEFWVEDFALNQQAIADAHKRGAL